MEITDIHSMIDVNLDNYRELTLQDRCDRCGESSQAFVRTIKEVDGKVLELLYCGHHFRKYEPQLLATGWLIQDERHRINEKPQSGDPAGRLDDED